MKKKFEEEIREQEKFIHEFPLASKKWRCRLNKNVELALSDLLVVEVDRKESKVLPILVIVLSVIGLVVLSM
ncbi:hypothetical protein GF373_17240 [bacterium]|nr:hypothetical protein [bacterium]